MKTQIIKKHKKGCIPGNEKEDCGICNPKIYCFCADWPQPHNGECELDGFAINEDFQLCEK